MTVSSPAWLLLITNLPGHNPTLRMRTWRAMKTAGAGLMRDGAYLLPASAPRRRLLEEQRNEIRGAGGLAQLLSFDAEPGAQHDELVALFDRAAEYGEVIARLTAVRRGLRKLSESGARQHLAGISREAAAIMARDFFPGEPLKQMERALADAEAAVNAHFAPDEPSSSHGKVRPRNRKQYRSRTWATRKRIWIDRVASAWLIRRFIDPKARFLWLEHVRDCPKRVVGFDFDGAEFTHADSRVTFEVLLASFALDGDPGLVRLGALVHHLDVGGIPIAEAPGLAAIMAGARALQRDDDALLKAMNPVLDSLYAGYTSVST